MLCCAGSSPTSSVYRKECKATLKKIRIINSFSDPRCKNHIYFRGVSISFFMETYCQMGREIFMVTINYTRSCSHGCCGKWCAPYITRSVDGIDTSRDKKQLCCGYTRKKPGDLFSSLLSLTMSQHETPPKYSK